MKTTVNNLDRKATLTNLNRKATLTKLDRKATLTNRDRKATLTKLDRKATLTNRDRKATLTNRDMKATLTYRDRVVFNDLTTARINIVVYNVLNRHSKCVVLLNLSFSSINVHVNVSTSHLRFRLVSYENIDQILLNELHEPMHYKIGVTFVHNENVFYTLYTNMPV